MQKTYLQRSMSAVWPPKSDQKNPGVQNPAVGEHIGIAEAQLAAED